MSNVTNIVNAMRDHLHNLCKGLPPKEYYAVLQELSADLDANIDALKEENEGVFD